MRKFLDAMFLSKKWGILIPILLASTIYLLYILFSNTEDKVTPIIAFPIISVIWFFGVYLIVYAQIKNAMCPEWFLNLFEFAVTVCVGVYGIVSAVRFIANGFQYLDYGLCIGLLTYSSVCWAHSKRS